MFGLEQLAHSLGLRVSDRDLFFKVAAVSKPYVSDRRA